MGDKAGVNGFSNTRLWPKGKSPNPGGKTKAEVAARRMAVDLINAETDSGREIIMFAIDVMRGTCEDIEATDAKSRRWAADFLADRVWGKAPLTVTVAPAVSVTVDDLRGKSLAELEQLTAELDALPPGESEDSDGTPGDVH